MENAPEIPAEWTEPERRVWAQIAEGKVADLNTRGPNPPILDPSKETGWSSERRLRPEFLQTILTKKAFVEATPHGGVRIVGALVDQAPLDLERARLPYSFWLIRCRILTAINCCNLRVDGELPLAANFITVTVDLGGGHI